MIFQRSASHKRGCTGRLPFQGSDIVSTLLSVATDQPPALVEINSEVPEDLSNLVMQLPAKHPEQRPGSAQAVVVRGVRRTTPL